MVKGHKKACEILFIDTIGYLFERYVFSIKSNVHFWAAKHHDGMGIKNVSKCIGMALVFYMSEFPCFFVYGKCSDGIDLFVLCQFNSFHERGIGIGSAFFRDLSCFYLKIGCNCFDGLKISRNGKI